MLYKRVKSDVCSRIDYFFAQGQFVLTWVPFEPRSKIESSFVRVITVSSKIIYFRIIRLNRGDSLSCIVYITMTLKRQKILSRTRKVEIDAQSSLGPVHYECAIVFYLTLCSGDPQGRIWLSFAMHNRMPATAPSNDAWLLETNAKRAHSV